MTGLKAHQKLEARILSELNAALRGQATPPHILSHLVTIVLMHRLEARNDEASWKSRR